jgi:hypothetical protein
MALPKAADRWSLISLREKLIKIGAKVASPGRYITFEVAVSRQMFADILSLITRLRAPPRPHEGPTASNAAATTAEVRLDAVGAARFSAAASSTGGFERHLRATSAVVHCSSPSKGRFPVSNPPGIWRTSVEMSDGLC